MSIRTCPCILNEVLSITAQELSSFSNIIRGLSILNEVLSITAQELVRSNHPKRIIAVLNEVLSITAQECGGHCVLPG